jgi:ATP-dependent Clp protease ATP-binding subunit ClpA
MTTDHYIVYSQVLDCFVKVRRLQPEDIGSIFEALDKKLENPNFSINGLVRLIVKKCVVGFEAMQKKYGDVSVFNEAVYEAVTEVYPMLTADTACSHYNIVEGEEEEEMGLLKPYNMKELISIKQKISKNIIGQDQAINEMFETFKLLNSGFESFASLFFIGTTGVGKTELARQTAEHYLKNPKRLLKINCAEYAGNHEYAKLIGSPPGYIGSNEKGILTERAEESSQWVILFDEIEKASDKLHNLLLGLLDEGTIMDNRGAVLDFSNSIILFTSNVGVKDSVNKTAIGFGEDADTSFAVVRQEITSAFKKEFPPEFINRIDSVVYFNQLTPEDAAVIAKLNLRKLPINITKKLVTYVVDNAYSAEFGARNIKRFIKKNVTLKLADKILEGSTCAKFKAIFKDSTFTIEETKK